MVNSFVSLEQAAAHMHQGAGPGSLQQAAGAWSAAAHKLATAAEEILSAITRCEEQYWQSPAAQQAREAITSVTQELKHHAVIAEQTKTAATRVAKAFDKAQRGTITPRDLASNREYKARLAETNRLGLHQAQIAELDAVYDIAWLHSIVAYDDYCYETSHAIERVEPWWSPHQQPADTPTITGEHPPTPDAPDIASQITQHRDTAARARAYAIDHGMRVMLDQQPYDYHSTEARFHAGLADPGNATAELYNKVIQCHREIAQIYKDLRLDQVDIPALAPKYVDLATICHQTKHQAEIMINAYHAAVEDRSYSRTLLNDLLEIKWDFTEKTINVFKLNNLDLFHPDPVSYANGLQRMSEEFPHATWEGALHEGHAAKYASSVASIRSYALDHAEKASEHWHDAHQHARSITDNVRDFVVFLQTAARQDDQATRLAGSAV